MKAVNYISILLLLVLGSCSSHLYTGVEYDDLYYLPADKPAVAVNKQITEGDLKAEEYYDNIYAADTLVSDEYSDATDYEALLNENNKGTVNNYYLDDYSYSGRLRRFYGNYFYPYWRDPFYFSFGWPSISFGYGYPYYDPFWYDPYYDFGYYGYYGGYYSPWYYGGYYSPYYSSWYWPYYNNWGYYSYGRDYDNSIAYGRRERQSVYSTRWNERIQPSASSRRDGYISKGSSAEGGRRSAAGASTYTNDPRKAISTNVDGRQAVSGAERKPDQSAAKDINTVNSRTSAGRSTTVTKPEYNTVNRTYTPSYSNPRMSTRPSYNTSRISTENQGSGSYVNTPARTSPSVSAGQSRSSVPSYRSSGSYSAPSRRSSGSGYSSSGSSSSRSSYSSGSSGGVSRSSSYSGGSSSGGSSSSSSSSGSSHSSSSGGRR